MMSKVSDAKKTGRPATGVGVPVTVRFNAAQLAALDAWIKTHEQQPSRPEAIRSILQEKLGG